MNDPWWKRRKKKAPWFNDIYEELERLGALIDETMQKAFDSSETSSVTHNRAKGFYINFGPDGKPKIEEFGHRQLVHAEDNIGDDQEPLVDLIEDGETLTVLVSLPGVKKDAIDLRVTGSCLTVSVDGAEFEWYDELKLPVRVNPKSACASYKNGVLNVKLTKSKKLVKGSKIL